MVVSRRKLSSGQKWLVAAGVFVGLGLVGGLLQAVGVIDDGDAEPRPTAEASSEPAVESGEGPEELTGEDRYLDAVYEAARGAGSGIHGKGDAWVLELGYAVCEDIEGGMAPTEVVADLKAADEGVLDPVSPVAVEVVGNAQLYLCPGV